MICRACDLDGPCSSTSCEARGAAVYRCPSCTAPHTSSEAAKACERWDDDTRSIFTD